MEAAAAAAVEPLTQTVGFLAPPRLLLLHHNYSKQNGRPLWAPTVRLTSFFRFRFTSLVLLASRKFGAANSISEAGLPGCLMFAMRRTGRMIDWPATSFYLALLADGQFAAKHNGPCWLNNANQICSAGGWRPSAHGAHHTTGSLAGGANVHLIAGQASSFA